MREKEHFGAQSQMLELFSRQGFFLKTFLMTGIGWVNMTVWVNFSKFGK